MFTFILMGSRPYFHLLEANLSHIAKHYPDAAVMFYDWGLKPGQRLRLKDRHPVLEIIDWKDRISCQGNLFDVPDLERIRQVAAKFTSELSQIECTLPGDRWTLRKSDERDRRERVRVWIKDSENVANIFFLELNRPRRHKYETIDEWIEKRVIPRWLERYGKDDYTVQSKDKGEATLGSGQRVKTVKYSLLIHDNNYRDLRFAYFTNGEGTRWSYLFVSNFGADRDQEDAFREIMKGITLRP